MINMLFFFSLDVEAETWSIKC